MESDLGESLFQAHGVIGHDRTRRGQIHFLSENDICYVTTGALVFENLSSHSKELLQSPTNSNGFGCLALHPSRCACLFQHQAYFKRNFFSYMSLLFVVIQTELCLLLVKADAGQTLFCSVNQRMKKLVDWKVELKNRTPIYISVRMGRCWLPWAVHQISCWLCGIGKKTKFYFTPKRLDKIFSLWSFLRSMKIVW